MTQTSAPQTRQIAECGPAGSGSVTSVPNILLSLGVSMGAVTDGNLIVPYGG
jgi:hypothetical protein